MVFAHQFQCFPFAYYLEIKCPWFVSLWISFYFACSYPGIQLRKAAWLLEQMMEKLAYLTPSPAGKKAFKFIHVRSCWFVTMHRWCGLSWGVSLLLDKSKFKLKLVTVRFSVHLFTSPLCLVASKVILLKLHDQRSSVGGHQSRKTLARNTFSEKSDMQVRVIMTVLLCF